MNKTENRKFGLAQRWLSGLLGLTLVFGLMPFSRGVALAASAGGSVVINEVAWAGTADNSSDEWIELYNNTAAAVDMSGWQLKVKGVVAYTFPSGAAVATHGYALIADRAAAISDVQPDFVFNMTLANAGASLQLVDAAGSVIDTVNGSGGAWYAGAVSTYASMERIDSTVGDVATNFASSKGGSGAHGAAGSVIMGTPKALNSVSAAGGGTVSSPAVKAEFVSGTWVVGQTVKLQVKAQDVADLFAYGYELDYDPGVLDFQGVTDGTFLNAGGTVSTSFQSGLKGGEAGKLLVAEARTLDTKAGVTGSGVLFEVSFIVKSMPSSGTGVIFSSDSFSSSASGDLSLAYIAGSWTAPLTSDPVTSLMTAEGAARYQIKLSWIAPLTGADVYQIERKDVRGQWVMLGEATTTEFVDQDSVVGGGKIVPNLNYAYRVVAVKGTVKSVPVEISGQDTRGIKGDNNRTDLVDGRDLERLALHFAENDQATGFDALIDTTYDGVINGSDLIDLGANFARKY